MSGGRLRVWRRLVQDGRARLCVAALIGLGIGSIGVAQEKNPAAEAKTEQEMKPYKQTIPNTEVSFEMVAIPGGEFLLGSPESEAKRKPDEGPQVKVKIEPFWMGKYEVTWNEYDIWSFTCGPSSGLRFASDSGLPSKNSPPGIATISNETSVFGIVCLYGFISCSVLASAAGFFS